MNTTTTTATPTMRSALIASAVVFALLGTVIGSIWTGDPRIVWTGVVAFVAWMIAGAFVRTARRGTTTTTTTPARSDTPTIVAPQATPGGIA